MRGLRLSVCLLITFAVAAHGAVEVWSQSVFEIGAALLFLSWGITTACSKSRTVYWSELNWPILGFFVWTVLQLLLRITIYPYLTWTALLRWGACYLIFFVATQTFRDRSEMRVLTWFLVLLGFCVAFEAIIQHFTGGNKIYWVRDVESGAKPFGPYVDRNHFAGLMELLTPVGLGLLVFRGVRRDLAPLAVLFTALPIGALFLSASRGGLISFLFELVLFAVVARARKSRTIRIGTLAVFAVAVAVLVAWLGVGRTFERFRTEPGGEVSQSRRVSMMKGASRVFLAHPITGTGLGTLVVAFPRYDTDYDGKLVDHAHNDYVETLADLGLPGALCGAVFLGMLVSRGFATIEAPQTHFSFAYHAAALVACAGLLVHSFVDFNLHIPSNALIFLIQAGLATSPPLAPTESLSSQRTSSPRDG